MVHRLSLNEMSRVLPWRGSIFEQNVLQHHDKAVPKERNEHRAMAYEDTALDRVHRLLHLPMSSARILCSKQASLKNNRSR